MNPTEHMQNILQAGPFPPFFQYQQDLVNIYRRRSNSRKFNRRAACIDIQNIIDSGTF